MSKSVVGFIKIQKSEYYPEDTKELIDNAIEKVTILVDSTIYGIEDIVRYDEDNSVEIIVNGYDVDEEEFFLYCKTVQELFESMIEFMS